MEAGSGRPPVAAPVQYEFPEQTEVVTLSTPGQNPSERQQMRPSQEGCPKKGSFVLALGMKAQELEEEGVRGEEVALYADSSVLSVHGKHLDALLSQRLPPTARTP